MPIRLVWISSVNDPLKIFIMSNGEAQQAMEVTFTLSLRFKRLNSMVTANMKKTINIFFKKIRLVNQAITIRNTTTTVYINNVKHASV